MYFFFNDTATTEIYTYGHTLSLHDALPICRAPVDLRVNRLKGDPDRVAQHYPDAARIAGLPDALRLPEGAPVELSDPWKWGQVEVQDAGSQLISAVCAAAPGMTVIDLCAGAGGKTLALAAAMGGKGDRKSTRLNSSH